MPTQSAAVRLFPGSGSGSGVLLGSAATRMRAAGAVRFLQGKGSQEQQGKKKNPRLSALRSPGDLIPADIRWWTPQLRPEDLVQPTGQGVEELQAIWDALVWEPLQPICLALQEILATGGNIFRCQSFHAGLVSGPLLIAAGICKLYTVAPNLFMDIVLGYIFYKLSVLAAHLKRKGKANNICARIQFVLITILSFKRNNPTKDFYYRFTEFFWMIALEVYGCKMYCECVGLEHPRQDLEGISKKILTVFKEMLTTIGDMIKG